MFELFFFFHDSTKKKLFLNLSQKDEKIFFYSVQKMKFDGYGGWLQPSSFLLGCTTDPSCNGVESIDFNLKDRAHDFVFECRKYGSAHFFLIWINRIFQYMGQKCNRRCNKYTYLSNTQKFYTFQQDICIHIICTNSWNFGSNEYFGSYI